MKNILKTALIFTIAAMMLFVACGDDDDDDASDSEKDDDTESDDGLNDDVNDDANDDADDDSDDDADDDTDEYPDIVNPPDSMPFFIERESAGDAPSTEDVAQFTQTMKSFYEGVDYFRWATRHSFGLADNNEWEQTPYKIWWTNTYAVKEGDTVTFTWTRPSDNSTAKVGRVLPAVISYFLLSGDAVARDLALGYIRGLSAAYDGMIWAGEDPVIDSLMARTIFHRNHSWEADGGRKAAVDYDAVRYEIIERRHDTIHNPDNPTWGDIWVRNKRSKDDFPYLYRNIPVLARLIRATDDDEMREAARKLYLQIVGMCKDIVENDYIIRTKGEGGEVFIPRTDIGLVDDFATFTLYEFIFPRAECNAKICTAYIAEGNGLDNDCRDGDGGLYEWINIAGHFWGSNMIWGFHVSAVSLALAFGDDETARELLDGLAARMDELMDHPWADDNVEWHPDMAQLLVLAAAYGLPLTGEEAQLVMDHFSASADHYNRFEYWDLWADAVPDGEYVYIPDRYVYDGGAAVGAYVRVPEITNLYEYCYSPLKDPAGARFVDCDLLLGNS